jgi:hypothetical protein
MQMDPNLVLNQTKLKIFFGKSLKPLDLHQRSSQTYIKTKIKNWTKWI